MAPGGEALETSGQAGRPGREHRDEARRWRIALTLALALSVLYGLPDLVAAFGGGPYVVQNDVRQHVFWMRRFVDPELFRGDLIASYYAAVAPPLYSLLYRIAASAGLDPVVFSKLLPFPLALATAAYAFGLAARVLPSRAAAFLAAVFLSQHVWLTDDLASGTPHAFAVPLLVAFLFHLSRRSFPGTLACLVLQSGFYPQIVVVSCGTLALTALGFEGGRLGLTRDPRALRLCAAGLVVAGLSLLPFLLRTSSYGPSITAALARQLPEFFRGGRSRFFDRSPWQFWMVADRSGLLAKFFAPSGPFIFAAPLMMAGLLLPLLAAGRPWFPLAGRLSREAGLLPRFAASSVLAFAAAHALLFRLHLPSRYSMFGARVLLAVAGGVTWAILADAAARWLAARRWGPSILRRARVALGCAGAVFLALPLFQAPAGDYVVGREPAIYAFFARQPKDALIASISPDADDLPTFSRRPVLVSPLHSVPYQLGYFRQVRRRALDLVNAEYAGDPDVLRRFLREYGVDFVLLDRWSFRPRTVELDSWVRQYRPLVDRIAARLEAGEHPALERMAPACTALETKRRVVLDAHCLLRVPDPGP